MANELLARNANLSTDFQRLGVNPHQIEPWEDGMRTSRNKKEEFEWWYFDTNLNDGSNLVVIYTTKSPFETNDLNPRVSFQLTSPDGKIQAYDFFAKEENFSAATDKCKISLNSPVGSSTFEGDLHHYHIHFEKDDVVADIDLTGDVPAWRNGTGISYFGDKYFGWIPAVPSGQVTADITIGGKQTHYTGTGYHDHNWGNELMLKLMHQWYWGRATVGNYHIISAERISTKKYGSQKLYDLYLSDNGKVVDINDDNLHVVGSDSEIDETTGKNIENNLQYIVNLDNIKYIVSYKRKKTIFAIKLIDQISGPLKKELQQVGFDGVYFRFAGDITVEKYVDNKLIDQASDSSGIWEFMYFGS